MLGIDVAMPRIARKCTPSLPLAEKAEKSRYANLPFGIAYHLWHKTVA